MSLIESLNLDKANFGKDHRVFYFTEQTDLEIEAMARSISKALSRRKKTSALSKNTPLHTELYARMISNEVLSNPTDDDIAKMTDKQIGHYLRSLEVIREAVSKDPSRWLIWCETTKLTSLMKTHYKHAKPSN